MCLIYRSLHHYPWKSIKPNIRRNLKCVWCVKTWIGWLERIHQYFRLNYCTVSCIHLSYLNKQTFVKWLWNLGQRYQQHLSIFGHEPSKFSNLPHISQLYHTDIIYSNLPYRPRWVTAWEWSERKERTKRWTLSRSATRRTGVIRRNIRAYEW